MALLSPDRVSDDNDDDRKDRTSRSAVVLNISEQIPDERVEDVRDALMEIEGVSRVHVCRHTKTITIEFEPNRSRCARRLIETVQESGFHATLRDRVYLPSQQDTYRMSASPSINTDRTEIRPAVISTRRQY